MKFVEYILEVCKENFGSANAFFKTLFGWIILGIGFLFFLNSNYYVENWKKPNWKLEVTPQGEILAPDIEIRDGYVIVCPQINVKYNDEIIYIINLKNCFIKNYSELIHISQDGQDNVEFILPIENDQKAKKDKLRKDFIYLLDKKMSDIGFEVNDKIKIYFSSLAFISYQNKRANQNRYMYVYLSDVGVRQMLREEVELRNSNNEIDLALFDVEQSKYMNEELIKQVEQCAEQIVRVIDERESDNDSGIN